jgi:cytosolic prostaglandin-E synthase
MSHPTVTWAQRPDSLWLSVDVNNPTDLIVDLTATELKLTCKKDGKDINVDITFFKSINVGESKYNQNRLIDFYIKKEEDESWPRLCDTNTKRPWLKVDWSKWVDSDDEGEPASFDQSGMGGMDMASMMGGMGGGAGGMDMASMMANMQNMGGAMGGMDDYQGDSDDEEDLPDLEAPAADAEITTTTSST